MPSRIEIIAIEGIPEIREGDNLAGILGEACRGQNTLLEDGDLVVVAQKIVSKAEGSVVDLGSVSPSKRAIELAGAVRKDPRLVEVVLQQSTRIVKSAPGVLITETIHGLVCANAGVDSSNSAQNDRVITLPQDPDRSARQLREGLESNFNARLSVVVSDSFGRPWREGSTNVAIGVSGFEPLHDSRGQDDDHGRVLQATVVALADELASAAQLVMGEYGGVPAAVVRGASVTVSERSSARSLQRSPEKDLFR